MVNKKIFILIIILAIPIIFMTILNLKNEKNIVQAKYLMLACENCTHMEVIKSSNDKLISQTIIPESNKYSMEDLIAKSITEKQDLCLEGFSYKYNLSNLLAIDPPGIRYKVERLYPLSTCNDLPSKENIL